LENLARVKSAWSLGIYLKISKMNQRSQTILLIFCVSKYKELKGTDSMVHFAKNSNYLSKEK